VLGRAVVRDVYGRRVRPRVPAYMSAAMALAPAIGPISAASPRGMVGWPSIFLVLVL